MTDSTPMHDPEEELQRRKDEERHDAWHALTEMYRDFDDFTEETEDGLPIPSDADEFVDYTTWSARTTDTHDECETCTTNIRDLNAHCYYSAISGVLGIQGFIRTTNDPQPGPSTPLIVLAQVPAALMPTDDPEMFYHWSLIHQIHQLENVLRRIRLGIVNNYDEQQLDDVEEWTSEDQQRFDQRVHQIIDQETDPK